MCCWLVVPVNGSMPICMANRKMIWAEPVLLTVERLSEFLDQQGLVYWRLTAKSLDR